MIRKWMVTGAGLLWIAMGIGTGAGKLWAAPQAARRTRRSPPIRWPNTTRIRPRTESRILSKKSQARRFRQAVSQLHVDAVHLPRLLPTTTCALKNFARAIEYADRMIALGDKIDAQGRLEAYVGARAGVLSRAGRQGVANSGRADQGARRRRRRLEDPGRLEEAGRRCRRTLRRSSRRA